MGFLKKNLGLGTHALWKNFIEANLWAGNDAMDFLTSWGISISESGALDLQGKNISVGKRIRRSHKQREHHSKDIYVRIYSNNDTEDTLFDFRLEPWMKFTNIGTLRVLDNKADMSIFSQISKLVVATPAFELHDVEIRDSIELISSFPTINNVKTDAFIIRDLINIEDINNLVCKVVDIDERGCMSNLFFGNKLICEYVVNRVVIQQMDEIERLYNSVIVVGDYSIKSVGEYDKSNVLRDYRRMLMDCMLSMKKFDNFENAINYFKTRNSLGKINVRAGGMNMCGYFHGTI